MALSLRQFYFQSLLLFIVSIDVKATTKIEAFFAKKKCKKTSVGCVIFLRFPKDYSKFEMILLSLLFVSALR